MFLLLLLISVSSASDVGGHNWQENLRPKLFCSMTPRDFTSFSGGNASGDHFTSLFYTEFTADANAESSDTSTASSSSGGGGGGGNGGVLLLGARNIVYKLTPSELRLTQTLQWPADDAARETCLVKGKSRELCQNFLVVIQQFPQDPARFMMCGTNAFTPVCREYADERGGFAQRSERNGLGLAPFDPGHNSTAVLVGEDLYSGTVADFTGVDAIVFRKPLRTQQYDSTQLNSPDFVGSFAHEDHVYFFFREAAVEYINCGKSVFSRVARVCKNDQGGPHKSKYSWTSFLKTRLNCSVPGEYPFYFDEIQGVTPIVRGKYGNAGQKKEDDYLVYATFSTPVNSIGGSAVCAFRLRDISDAFSGRFKEQRSMSANWLPVDDHKVPNPRPGTCMNDTKSLPDVNLNFIKTHVLMDDPVLPFFGAPIVIRTGLVSKFTVIAVDPQVRTTDGKTFDVIFIGTTGGRVIKAINAQSADSREEVQSVIIEELQVFSNAAVIRDLKVMGKAGMKSLGQLVVMTTAEVRSFPVQRCDRASNCQECVALQDPYCAWELRSSRCSSGDWTKNMGSSFLQSVPDGLHSQCPGGAGVLEPVSQVFSYERQFSRLKLGQVVNIVDESQYDNGVGGNSNSGVKGAASNSGFSPTDGPGVQAVDANQQLFSLEMLVITVSAGAVAALVVGFVTGYCCGRKCRKEEDELVHVPYQDTEYEYFEQRGGLARPLHQGGNGMMMVMGGGPGPGAPLLPSQINKLGDGRHEEVTYAEPELLTGPLRAPLTMNSMAPLPPAPRFPGESSHYSSSLLNPTGGGGGNKYNTLASANKRPLPSINHYESAAEARLGSGKDPAYYVRGRDNFNSYHMSTLGRSSSMRAKDPLLLTSSAGGDPRNISSNHKDGGTSSNGSSSNDNSSQGKGSSGGHQVVDSAYGTTTRSAKKVYL